MNEVADKSAGAAREWHVTVQEPGATPIDTLAASTDLSRQRLKHAMHCGAVWMTRAGHSARLRRARRELHVGDTLHLYYNPQVLDEQPVPPTLVDDGGVYSVWDKPSGSRSQGSKWGDHCTVMRWAEQHLVPQRNAFTVHRLDLAASGLIVVAHSKTAAADLSRQFRERSVSKRYRAVVVGDASALTTPRTIELPIDGKTARSDVHYAGRGEEGGRSVVEVAIHTGRKHQIRRHLASIGLPIVGDRLHGAAAPNDPDLMLRAVSLSFDHPETGRRVDYRLDSP